MAVGWTACAAAASRTSDKRKPKDPVRLGPDLHEELLAIAGERGVSMPVLAREMIRQSMQCTSEAGHEQCRAGPPSVLFLALQPQLLGRLG